MFVFCVFPFFAMLVMTVITIWTIQDECRIIRLLNKEYYYTGHDWCVIIVASLSIIILWVFYLYSVIKVLS